MPDWEAGSFKLPASEFRTLRSAFLSFVNSQTELRYLQSLEAYESVCEAVDQVVSREEMIQYLCDCGAPYYAAALMCEGEKRARLRKPMKPKKRDFPKLSTTRGAVLEFPHGVYVELDNSKHLVIYSVDAGLLAPLEAKLIPEIGKLLDLLDAVKWTARSGGTMVGGGADTDPETPMILIQYGGLGERCEQPI